MRAALQSAAPEKVVCLSTIAAQATETNPLTQRTLMEQALGTLTTPVTLLRPGWFMENAAWDVAPARDTGTTPRFLQPLDKAVSMAARSEATSVIIGARTEAHFEDNLNAQKVVLSVTQRDRLDRVSQLEVPYPNWMQQFHGKDRILT